MDRALKTLLLCAVVAAFSAVMLPAVPLASAAELDRKGKSDAKEALRFYKEGNYEDAAKLFLRLSINYPDMLVFVRNLGACYYYMRRYEPALSNLRDYLHRKTDIAANDRAEVAGWIGEMERMRDQAIVAAAAAPSTPSTAPPAAAVPPTPSASVPPPGASMGGGDATASSGGTATAPAAAPAPSTGAPASPPQPVDSSADTAPAAPEPSAVAMPTPAPSPNPSYSSQYPAQPGYSPQDQYAAPQPGYPPQSQYAPQPGYPPQGHYAPQPAYPSQGAYPPPSGSGYAQTYPPQVQTGYPQPAPSPSGVTAQAAPQPEQSSGTGRKVAAWIIGIAGLGTVAAGGYFSYKASTKFDEVEKKYDRSVEDEGKKAVLTAGVCYGVGGAAILTAIIVGAIGGSSGSVAIAPTVGPEGAGATLSGTF